MKKLKFAIFICSLSLLVIPLSQSIGLQAASAEDELDSMAESMLLGNVNGDSDFDVRDLIQFKKYCSDVEGTTQFTVEAADCNSDGAISTEDLPSVKEFLLAGKTDTLWRTAFTDEDGELLQVSYVRENTQPNYSSVPQKSSDLQYHYSFAGWLAGAEVYQTENLPVAVKATNYQANYEKAYNIYDTQATSGNAIYPRILRLNNGNYFLTSDYKYATSSDGIHFGSYTSWTSGSSNKLKYNPVSGEYDLTDCANAQPMLLSDGRVAVFFRANNTAAGYSSIRMIVGDEYGKNFGDPITLLENYYEGSTENRGMWEPYGIILKDGTLAVYVSCDIRGTTAYIDTEGNVVIPANTGLVCEYGNGQTTQNILVLTVEEQNDTFVTTNTSIVSNGKAHNSRDGMSVITQLADGSYAMVIEATCERANYPMVVQVLCSEDGKTWGDPITILRPKTTGNSMAAPYITTLPDGRVAVSCCTQEGYSGYEATTTDMKNRVQRVFISKEAVSKDSTDIEWEELNYRDYPENEYSIFGGVSYIDGRLYLFAQKGTNASDGTSTSAPVLLNYILYQYQDSGADNGTWTPDIIL